MTWPVTWAARSLARNVTTGATASGGAAACAPRRFGHVEDHALAQDAGAADHDVEVAEAGERRVDDRLATGHRRDALGVPDRLAPEGLDLLDHGLCGRARRVTPVDRHAEIVDDDPGARVGEPEGDPAPDTVAGAGHDRDLPVEQSHAWLLI